jgi:glycosyltransferase involved in cell wall biosynthesis
MTGTVTNSTGGTQGAHHVTLTVYKRADLFFLSSRLDPLPNVAIDAAMHGMPVIFSDQASVCAEIVNTSPATRELVVP